MVIGIDASRAFKDEKTGTENYSYHLISEFAKLKTSHKFRLYVKTFPSQKFPSNFEIRKISFPRLWTQAGLALEVLKSPPDVLFIPAHTMPFIKNPGLPTVVTIHDLGAEFLPQYHTFPSKIYLNWATELAVRFATKIIAVSEATKQDLVEKLGADSEKIEVVYEGVEQQKFRCQVSDARCQEVLKKYKINTPFVLFIGTIQPRKNVEGLIRAFAKILLNAGPAGLHPAPTSSPPTATQLRAGAGARRGSPKPATHPSQNLSLVIVGNRGWLSDEIYELPKKLGIEDRVKFLGYVGDNETPALYSAASLFVLPSFFEGFGLPILEAMASGCPVVTSNVSSMPEVAGDAAVLVDPKDTDEMAKKILEVLSSEKQRFDLIRKGLVRAQEFSWKKCAKETLKVLEKARSSIT